MSISIQGLDKATVLAALYNGAKAQGLGLLHYSPKPMTVEEAATILSSHGPYYDYLNGRVMKVDLSTDEIVERSYDRDNGDGTMARIIELLRQNTMNVDVPEIRQRSADNTASAAQFMANKLNDPPMEDRQGDTLIFNPGVSDMAAQLGPKIDEILGKSE